MNLCAVCCRGQRAQHQPTIALTAADVGAQPPSSLPLEVVGVRPSWPCEHGRDVEWRMACHLRQTQTPTQPSAPAKQAPSQATSVSGGGTTPWTSGKASE
jgi:hypothetical protein